MDPAFRNSTIQVQVLKALLGSVCVVFGLGLLIASGPQLHDFGEWLFQAQVLARKVANPETVLAYEVAGYPVPNSLAVVVMAMMCLVLPPLAAGKLFVAGLLTVWVFAAEVFSRRFFDGVLEQWICRCVIICCGGFGSFLFYGFVSYQLAAALLVWFVGAYRQRTSVLVVMTFSVLIFFSHAAIFLQLGLIITLCVFAGGFPVRHLLALIPSGLLSLWFLLGKYGGSAQQVDTLASWAGWVEAIIYKAGTLTMLGPFRNILESDGSAVLENLPALYWAGFAVNLLVSLALGLFVLMALWRGRGYALGQRSHRRALYLFASLLAALVVVAPQFFFGMLNPGVRLALPALLAAAAITTGGLPRAAGFVAMMIAVTTLGSVLLYSIAMVNGRQSEALASAPEVPPLETRTSVLAFNRWLYRHTRYDYYNYRVYAFDWQLQNIRRQDFSDLEFRTGLILNYTPAR